jgi:hypothetical protein
MIGVVRPVWKDEVVEGAAPALQPVEQACPRRFKQFELNRPASLLLDDDGALADTGATDELADTDSDQIAATQLAVDRQVEEGPVSTAMLLLQPKPDSPDLLGMEWSPGAQLLTSIPCRTAVLPGIID